MQNILNSSSNNNSNSNNSCKKSHTRYSNTLQNPLTPESSHRPLSHRPHSAPRACTGTTTPTLP